jgi:predicted nucleic acid-binding protein
MLVLDTNIVSELMRPSPAEEVLRWFDANPEETCMCAVTVAEIAFGLASMPDGRRQRELVTRFDALLGPNRTGVLPFDLNAAEIYGPMSARLRREGSQIGPMDAMIAATAIAHQASVVTRNVKHFALTQVECVNPFSFG